MRALTIFMFISGVISMALQPRQSCTDELLASMMGNMVMAPIQMVPSHIPTGCSDFEVLIGLYNINTYLEIKADANLS